MTNSGMSEDINKSPFVDQNPEVSNGHHSDGQRRVSNGTGRRNVLGEDDFMSARLPSSSILQSPIDLTFNSLDGAAEHSDSEDRFSAMPTPNLNVSSPSALKFKLPSYPDALSTPPTTSTSSMSYSKNNQNKVGSPFDDSNIIYEDREFESANSPFADRNKLAFDDDDEYYSYSQEVDPHEEKATKRHRWGTTRNKKGVPRKEAVNRSKTLRALLNPNGSIMRSMSRRHGKQKTKKHSSLENSEEESDDDEVKDPRDHKEEKRSVVFNKELPEEFLDPETGKALVMYPRNKIRTTKYTPISFLPKNIFNQFIHNIANIYFLALIILGAFDIFGVPNPALSAVPLIVIVLITACKDAVEDSRRTISDLEVNNQTAYILDKNHSNHDSDFVYVNHNVDDDKISLWRKFKKANSSLMFNFIEFCRSRLTKSGRQKRAREQAQEESTEIENARKSFDSDYATSRRNSVRMSSLDGGNIRRSFQRARASLGSHKRGSDKVLKFHKRYWKDVKVGDVIRIYNNDEIPADVVILSTSDEDNACYVETKNLDGETNLKVRHALKFSSHNKINRADDLLDKSFQINSEGPHSNLYTYNGNIEYYDETTGELSKEAITINNLLLRGYSLRNTKWVIAIVVFTGPDTKIMLNAGVTPTKQSKMSRDLNYYVLLNFILLFIICFVSGLVSGIWYTKDHMSRSYFEFGTVAGSPAKNGLVNFFVAVIIYSSLVPISLYITIEIIKTAQAFFIFSDIGMYYERLDYPCTPKSWSVSDDLGQIEYVFSDKTGTLTQNLMEFKKCTVNGIPYGRAYTEALAGLRKRQGVDVETEAARERKIITEERYQMIENLRSLHKNEPLYENDLTFVSNDFVEDLKGKSGEEQKACNEHFMLALALCHSVLTEEDTKDPKRILYKAQSPDEAALVETARSIGFEFKGNTKTGVLIDVMGSVKEFQVLNVLEFNSTRKRMSAIVKVSGSNPSEEPKALLICKGADSVIYSRLSKTENDPEVIASTAQHLEQFAQEGLRTLCIAQRELSWAQYSAWNNKHREASAALDKREEMMEEVADSIERELVLLGGTAIEDRLQDGVPDAISILIQAGIKLWVLTGDKVETAINIGFSCNLLSNEMELLVLRSSLTEEDRSKTGIYDADLDEEQVVDRLVSHYLKHYFNMVGSLEEKEAAIGDHTPPSDAFAIVIDGDALKLVLINNEIKRKFLLLCKQCKAVLCCRVSPAQKAGVVKLVKETLEVMTLAIGDGSNDVAMIQAADVGIGIVGEEGRQAAMSSDYAVGQFRYLSRLLLTHGRWSYKRFSEMIPSFFYKNVIFSIALFWYGIYNDFDGSYLFEFTYLMFYNLAFTSLPIIFLGILDQDVPANVSLLVPQLYRSGILGTEWTQTKFWWYMADAIYQSIISFFFPYLMYYKGFQSESGLPLDHRFWMGVVVTVISCTACNLYILLHQYRWDWWSVMWVAISILFVYTWTGIWTSSLASREFYKAAAEVFGATAFWACSFIGILVCLLPRFFYDCIQKLYYPTDTDIIRECVHRGDFSVYPDNYDPTDPNKVKVSQYTNEYVARISMSGLRSPDPVKNSNGSLSDLEQNHTLLDYAQSSAVAGGQTEYRQRHLIGSPDITGEPKVKDFKSMIHRATHTSRESNKRSFMDIFKSKKHKSPYNNSSLYNAYAGTDTSVNTEEIPMEDFNRDLRRMSMLSQRTRRSETYPQRIVRSSLDLPELTTMNTLHSSASVNER